MSEIRIIDKTAITWANSGGDAVMSLQSLATTICRKGAGHNFGATRPRLWDVWVSLGFTAAPAAGASVHIYWARSQDGTTYAAGLSASDEDIPVIGSGSKQQRLDMLDYVGTYNCQNATTEYKQLVGQVEMTTQYGAPAIQNSTLQSFAASGCSIALRPHVPTDAT